MGSITQGWLQCYTQDQTLFSIILVMFKYSTSPLLVLVLLSTFNQPSSPLPSSPQCGGAALSLSNYHKLDKFCEDCYNLFMWEEILSECRADCFRNDAFYLCMNLTMVDKDTQQGAIDILVGIDGGGFLGVDVHS